VLPEPGPEPEPNDSNQANDPFAGPDWDEPTGRSRIRTSPEQIRKRSRAARRRRRRRQLLVGGLLLAAAALAGIGWLAYTGFRARTELQAVRSEVHSLRAQIAAGDLTAARSTAAAVRVHAARAHDLTGGPLWALGAGVPYLGNPLDSARALSAGTNRIAADALPALVDASTALDPKTLRRPDGSYDLAPIERVASLLGTADDAMQQSLRQVSAAPGSTWLGSVDAARRDLLGVLPPLVNTVHNANVASRTVPALLGADGPKNYLVSFLNEAELRGLGGLPGAFAILRADHGRLSFARFESDSTLGGVPSGVHFGADFNRLYSSTPDATTAYSDSDISPHFPYAAQIWLGQWRHKSGQQLDGAAALDPTALSYLLAVTGPATMADGTVVSSSNVVALTQRTAYQRFPAINSVRRKEFLLDLARAVATKLVHSSADPTGLVKAAARAVGEHRLVVWSRDAEVERRLSSTTIAGQVPRSAAPYAGLSINNGGATKLDYYLHASLDWSSSGCGRTREVTVTVRLANNTPAHVPAYVLGQTGRPGLPAEPGINRTLLAYYATAGSHLAGVTVNGRPAFATSGVERGHPVLGLRLDLPVGTPQTVVFHLVEPSAGGAAPISRMQPMINPVALTVHDPACGA
jgi:hypothetical protein